MEEIQIAIEDLKLQKSDLQNAIAKPFAYGRFPNDDEFSEITNNGLSLWRVESAISALSDALEAINHNSAIAASKR